MKAFSMTYLPGHMMYLLELFSSEPKSEGIFRLSNTDNFTNCNAQKFYFMLLPRHVASNYYEQLNIMIHDILWHER